MASMEKFKLTTVSWDSDKDLLVGSTSGSRTSPRLYEQQNTAMQKCPKLSKRTKTKVKKKLAQGKKPVICYECNKLGHMRDGCPKLQADSSSSDSEEGAEPSGGAAASGGANTQQLALPAPASGPEPVLNARALVNTGGLNSEQMHRLVMAIRGAPLDK